MSAQGSDRTVCVLSLRGINSWVSRCSAYELEDLVCDLEGADLIQAKARRRREQPSRLLDIISRRTPWTVTEKPIIEPARFDRQYDVALVVVQTLDNLSNLEAFPNWREHCRTAICYVEEEYRGWIEKYSGRGNPLRLLESFDHVFLNCVGSVDALHDATGLPVHYVAPGIDALRFRPRRPLRSTDLYYMGRRSPATHDALIQLLKDGRISYAFDSTDVPSALDPAQHRMMLAGNIQNSRYFVVQKAKAGRSDHSFGQEEMGLRYFEGAAAGAVMIGSAPSVETFEQYFDWPDAVIPMPYDCPEVGELLAELDSQPERMERVRRENVTQCLRRHDWSHRWSAILRSVGLPEARGTAARRAKLDAALDELSGLF